MDAGSQEARRKGLKFDVIYVKCNLHVINMTITLHENYQKNILERYVKGTFRKNICLQNVILYLRVDKNAKEKKNMRDVLPLAALI